jgi:hypothetical protein
MALGPGRLRTKELTEQVPGYAPRTIYRYAGRLAELDVIERDEERGVPSKVLYCLTDPCGTNLFALMDSFASASMCRLPDSRIDVHDWASLGLLADLWESGMVGELSCVPRSPTQLAQAEHGLSYHQVNRRANLFKTGALLREAQGDGRQRCYELTGKARRAMALVAGIGRWRHDYVVPDGQRGFTVSELAIVLRTVLPLVQLPEQAGRKVRLDIIDGAETNGDEGEVLWARVAADGMVDGCASPADAADGWCRADVKDWLAAILDGERGGLQTDGDQKLVDSCLAQLYETLWTPVQSFAELARPD